MATRCTCGHWRDRECEKCGYTPVRTSRIRARFFYGTCWTNGIPGFALGVLLGSDVIAIMLGPITFGINFVDA